MNHFAAYSVQRGGGWWAMVRFARDAKPNPIMGEGDSPQTFPDELAATKAALHHVLNYFNGNLVASREIEGCSIRDVRRAQAEKLFANDRTAST